MAQLTTSDIYLSPKSANFPECFFIGQEVDEGIVWQVTKCFPDRPPGADDCLKLAVCAVQARNPFLKAAPEMGYTEGHNVLSAYSGAKV
jgi:hypothetical protein